MDPEKRAAYDALAGFSGNAVNPFRDTLYERDHVRAAYVASLFVWLFGSSG